MFIAFDGIDGSGKSSQVHSTINRIKSKGFTVFEYDMGEEGFIDEELSDLRKGKLSCSAEIRELLYYFEGVLFGQETVAPLLDNKNKYGIVDRYLLSFLSYGPLNGIAKDRIKYLTKSMPWPDLYFFVNTTPDVAASRIQNCRKITRPEIGYKNVLSQNKDNNIKCFLEHQTKVYNNFIAAVEECSNEGKKIIILDGNLPMEVISEQIASYIDAL